MAESSPKRNIPPALAKLLEWDKKVTKEAFEAFDKKFGYQKNELNMKYLEISAHGLIWLVACVALLYFGFSPLLWMNMLVLQVLDIVLIAGIKAFVRRRRPSLNKDDMFFTKGPDKFSFPSGHASRAFAVAFFFFWLYPVNILLQFVIGFWAVATAISRVTLARHHILDVAGGFVLALVEYWLMCLIWMGEEKSRSWANTFTDNEDPWSSG